MKKAALVLTIFFVLAAFALSPAWSFFYNYISRNSSDTSSSVLLFQSIQGEYRVSINDSVLGTIPTHEKKEFLKIEPGKHKVTIERVSDVENFFQILERNIDFYPSAKVEITWEAGPTLESSSGTIKYFSSIVKPEGSEVYVQSFPTNARVEFDNKNSNDNLFNVFDTSVHTLRVSNGEGFEEYVTKVSMKNDSSKKVLTNLRLTIEVYLYKSPF